MDDACGLGRFDLCKVDCFQKNCKTIDSPVLDSFSSQPHLIVCL